MSNQFADGVRHEFRGWSLMHWVFDVALTWIAAVIISPLATFTVTHVILLCLGVFVAVTAAISLWLRRNEGYREARAPDKSEAKGSVKERLSQLAQSIRNVEKPEEADAAARRAVRYAAGYFHKSVSDKLAGIIDKIACRTDWREVLDEIADELDTCCQN